MNFERKRILFVSPDLAGGGAERATVNLLRHLDRTRLDLHLALASVSGRLLEQLPADVPVHDLGARRVRHARPPLCDWFGR